jgi:hypothetical protein
MNRLKNNAKGNRAEVRDRTELFSLVPGKETSMVPLVDRREKAEKGLSLLSTPGDRFAYWLSQITSPFVVGLGVFGYVALSTASTVAEGVDWLTVIGVGLLVPCGHADHERGEIQDQPACRLGSRRSDGLLPAGWPGVSGALSLGGADRLGTLETGGAHPTSGHLWGSPCRSGNGHHVLAL